MFTDSYKNQSINQ